MEWWGRDPRRRRATGVLAAGGVALLLGLSVAFGWVAWAALGRWAQLHAVPLALFAAAGLCVVAGVLNLRGSRPKVAAVAVVKWWLIVGAAVLVVVVTWGATSYLLAEAATAKDVGAARVDAIKTGLGIGAGATGIFALVLALRRQWHNEFDATEKNVTELYAKAAGQLGDDKAPVRMAGLYSLERLAQGNPRQRQSIVNVICAYLRMPYDLPDEKLEAIGEQRERLQEREVRLAAQRMLADHAHPGRPDAFWYPIDLDLTNAHLIDFSLIDCRVRNVRLVSSTFTGGAWFTGATFTGIAWFDYATFAGCARFDRATFGGHAGFVGTTFTESVVFAGATFTRGPVFEGARGLPDPPTRPDPAEQG